MILPGINSQTIAQLQRMAFRSRCSSPDQASDVNRNRENETHLKFHHKGRTQRGHVSTEKSVSDDLDAARFSSNPEIED
jgi:hypothetical protein